MRADKKKGVEENFKQKLSEKAKQRGRKGAKSPEGL